MVSMYSKNYGAMRDNLNKLEGIQKKNVIPINLNESEAHITQKFKVALEVRKLGENFIAEAKFKHCLGRADLYLIDSDIVIEIIDSEKVLKPSKELKYPVKKIVSILAGDVLRDIRKLL